MSGKSEYAPGSDGLLARVSGEWARAKLYYVERYMAIFSGGMRSKWEYRGFIDLMAGCGRCIFDDGTGEEFDGSPLLALRTTPPFTHVVLVEADAELHDALSKRTAALITPVPHIIRGNCNDPTVVEEIRSGVPARALSLAFADMLGFEVEFETVRRLSENRSLDWLITFQTSDLKRNVRDALADPKEGARLDRFFGTPNWRDEVLRFDAGDRRGRELDVALMDFYAERLQTLGYGYFAKPQRAMRNSREVPLYRLLLAARHERAQEFFQKITNITYEGQRSLL